jgi:hypothetical protein
MSIMRREIVESPSGLWQLRHQKEIGANQTWMFQADYRATILFVIAEFLHNDQELKYSVFRYIYLGSMWEFSIDVQSVGAHEAFTKVEPYWYVGV